MSSILNGISYLTSGINYLCKILGIIDATREAIAAKNDPELSSTQKAALIGANGIFIVAQVADFGYDIAQVGSVSSPDLTFREGEQARARTAFDKALLKNQEQAKIRAMPKLDQIRARRDYLRQLHSKRTEAVLPQDMREIILLSRQPTSTQIIIKGIAGVADISRVTIKKIFKFQRHGLNIHDYMDVAHKFFFRTHEMSQFIPQLSPEFFESHANRILIFDDIIKSCAAISGDSRMLETVGRYVLEKIRARRIEQRDDLAAEDEISEEESLSEGAGLGLDFPESGSEISSISTSTEYSEAEIVQFPPDRVGEIVRNVIINVFKNIKDITELEVIPEFLSLDSVLKKFQCAISKMNGKPKLIRHIMMIRGDLRSRSIFYERNEIYRWFEEHPGQCPPEWPSHLEFSRQILDDFNQNNEERQSMQDEIDTRLQECIADLQDDVIQNLGSVRS